MSRIDLHIVGTANFAQAEASIARLKTEIASINSMGLMSPATSRNMQSTFANALTASGMFQARMVNLTSDTEKFGRALERGSLRGMQYFRAGSQYLTKQQGQIRSLAREHTRLQQTRGYGFGDGRTVAVTPRGIDDAIHKQQLLNNQHRIFREVVRGGATQLINWGKNTQWAGRQLTVGLTMPLVIFGSVAGKMFMDIDKQLTRMVKVYGDASKGAVDVSELQKIRGEVAALAQELSSSMGIAATETAGIAADIAATGKQGQDLLASTREAMRLSVLGEVDRQEAMKATLAIQSAFEKDTVGLTESINFLNAVENQTSTTLNDLVEGIVKAGPVVKGLGGDVEDLALMMVAMREGGIPAAEAANAIKSSLASLINPTKQTTEVLGDFGINIKEIVDQNAGDVIGTLMDLQTALSGLDDLSRQRSIEQIFGKFQFSRINALLSNLNKAGGQTQQVMEIAGMSTIQLAQTADRELSLLTESTSMKFTRAVEGLKSSLIPIGESFVELGTTVLEFFKGFIDGFNNLPGPIKTFIKYLALIGGMIIPSFIMMIGILGNFLGYLIKMGAAILGVKKSFRGVFENYTVESEAARNLTNLLTAEMYNQKTATGTLKSEIDKLVISLKEMITTMNAIPAAAGGASAAATTLAGSARAALAAGGSAVPLLRMGGKDAGKKYGKTFAGPEFSHLYPGSMLPANIRNVQTVGTLLPGGSNAAAFQRQLNVKFQPDFYDPSQGSRQDVLRRMALNANRPDLLKTLPNMSQTEMTRLLPSREEYNAYVAKYHASLRTLGQMATNELQSLTQRISAAASAGDMAKADEILQGALIKNKAAFDTFYQKELMAVQAMTGNLEQVVTQVGTRTLGYEKSLSTKPGTGFRMSDPTSMYRMVSASAGGGTIAGAAGHREVHPAEKRLIDAREKLAVTTKAMDAVERETIAKEEAVQRGLVSLKNSQDKVAQVHSSTWRAFEKWQQVINQNGEVVWKNTQTGQELIVAGQNLTKKQQEQVAKLQNLLALKQQEEMASRHLAEAQEKYAVILRMGPGIANKEIAAKQELEAAEREYAAQLRTIKALRNKDLLNTSGINDTKERATIRAALNKLAPEIYEEIVSVQRLTVGNRELAAFVDETGTAIKMLDMSTKKLITAEEAAALKIDATQFSLTREKYTRETLIQEMREQAAQMNLSQSAQGRLAIQINNLSDEVLQTITGLNVLQTGINRAALELTGIGGVKKTTDAIKTQSMLGAMLNTNRGRGAAMGIGMGASLGMMFMPHGDSAAGKIGMGAAMGAGMGSMFGLPGLAIGTALGAAIPTVMAFKDEQQKTNDALVKYSEALYGSSVILDGFAKEAGKLKPSEQLTAAIGNLPMTPKDQQTGQAVLETETGKKLLETAKMFSGKQLEISLLDQLKQLTLMEIFTPDEAKSVAQMLAIELANPELGNALLQGLGSVIDKDGKVISDKVAETFMQTIPDIAIPEFGSNQIQSYLSDRSWQETLAEAFTASNFFDEIGNDWFNAGQASTEEAKRAYAKFAQESIPQLASQLDKLREAQALVTQEFMSGEITFEKYSSMMEDIQKKNIYAADAIMKMKEAGADVGALLKDIADAAGRGEDYKKIEEVANNLRDVIGVGDRFVSQMQLGAAYGDITVGGIQELADLASNPEMAVKITALFDTAGGEDNAMEIIKMIQMGVDPELLVNISTNANQIGKPLADVYGLIVSISGLPENIKKSILAEVESDPAALEGFIDKYEYLNSLPMDNVKKLKAEVFGNPELQEIANIWEDFLALPEEERKNAIVHTLYDVEYSYTFPSGAQFGSASMAEFSSPMDASAIAQSTVDNSSGGGGSSGGSGGGSGGSGGGSGSTEAETKAIEEKYDRQIEAQQKLIDKINEERDARQKVLDVQKEAMNFALREADLKAEIARAKAEGDVAKAALLQGQLESEKKQYMMDEAERRRQEQEDARIKRAEEEIKRLEEQKQKELDKINNASSGGGGSSGSGGGGSGSASLSAEEQAALEKRIQFVNDRLMAALKTIGLEEVVRSIYMNGAEAFWDSKPVKEYEQALKELGVPAEVIKQQLESLFDSIVSQSQTGQQQFEDIRKGLEQVGISGESANKIIANVWSIINDPDLDKQSAIKQLEEQFREAGAKAGEARKMAQKFIELDGMDLTKMYATMDEFKRNWEQNQPIDGKGGEIASSAFLSGISKGFSDEEILSNIKSKLEKAYIADVPKDIPPDVRDALILQARQRAATEAEAIVQWYKENPLDLPPADIQINATVQFNGNNPNQGGVGSGPGGAMPVDELANDGSKGGNWNGAKSIIDDIFPSADEGAKRADETLQGYYERVLGYDVTPLQAAYFDKMAKTAMTALDSNSPSEVFKTIGNDAMQGFLDGINAFGTDGIAAAILGIVNVVNQGMAQTQVTVPPLSPTGTGAGAVWASNFNDIVAEVLGYGVINSAFSAQITLMMETFRQIITGETGFNFVITEEATLAAESLYTILTERMQETADQINEILRTTLTGYSFDIVGVPKIYVAPGTEDVWGRIIPNFASFPTTDTMPAETVEKAEGGYISGPGGPTDDLIPAMLSDGEYVIKASSVKHYGTGFLDEVNAGKFAEGGLVRLNPDNMTILGEKMADWMNQFAGVPYNSGGEWADGPENGWGCATAARWLYDRFAGINIGDDSLSAAQYASGVGKQVSDTMPGDQQFFYYANGVNVENPINHTGVAQSSSTMYHASGGSVGSYANAAIDTGARALAASRAGGTAQKRYLPETIGGMGMPVGYLKNGGFIRKLAGGGIANLFSTNISRPSGKTPEWPEDVENPYPEDPPVPEHSDDWWEKMSNLDFQMPTLPATSFGFKMPIFWLVDTTDLITSTGPGPDDFDFDSEEFMRRYIEAIKKYSNLKPIDHSLYWNKKPGDRAFKNGGFVAEGTPGSARGTGGRMAPSKPPEGEKSSPYFKKIQKVLSLARKHQSIPYGSEGFALDGPAPSAWGCATSLGWLWYNGADVNLPSAYRSYDQWRGLKKTVKNGAIMPGDLIFMKNPDPSAPNPDKPVNHVEMYMGPSRQISKGGKVPGAIWNGGKGIQSLSSYPPIRNGIKRVLGPVYRAMGGTIDKGNVYGPGGPTDDTVLAMLSNGEYVMSAYSVNKYGKDFMQRVNSGTLAEAAAGGLVSKYPSYVANLAMGGSVQKYSRGGEVDRDNTNIEYNINVNVAGTNASADEIAQTVLTHLKRKERMTGAVTRI